MNFIPDEDCSLLELYPTAVPVDAILVQHLQALTSGVVIDLDAPLSPDDD